MGAQALQLMLNEPDCISYVQKRNEAVPPIIYGIYDMAGGAYEEMANYNNMVGISGFNNGDEIA